MNPSQVFDITKMGAVQPLLMFRNVPEFRILVCGGDGTVGWVLNSLADVTHLMNCKSPGVGIIPIGTGNDLSRVLGWGPGYEGERIEPLLGSCLLAPIVPFDRWDIIYQRDGDRVDEIPPDWIMSNYIGIGIDAYIALQFHEKREAKPELFTSRARNKVHYAQIGAAASLSHPCKNLGKHLTMVGDDEIIDISSFEGIVILNIASFGGGADPWGSSSSKQKSEPSFGDGIVEVFGVTGIMQLGSIGGHMSSGTRIGQFNSVEFTVQAEGAANFNTYVILHAPHCPHHCDLVINNGAHPIGVCSKSVANIPLPVNLMRVHSVLHGIVVIVVILNQVCPNRRRSISVPAY